MTREEAKREIKEKFNCLDLLAKSKYGNYCCPFCKSGTKKDCTGAVKYYPNTNTWCCHACHRTGDYIDLYRNQTGTDYNTALLALADELGITIDPYQRQDKRKPDRDRRPERAILDHGKANTLTNQTPSENAPESPREGEGEADYREYYWKCIDNYRNINISRPAIAYLNGRGISGSTANMYGIGFDPQADPASAPGAVGDEYKPHPAPRIIIPVSQSYYIARSIDPNTEKAFAKINPKNSTPDIFNKSVLFTQDERTVFITEGIFDALSIIEAGASAIALNSTSNADKLIKELSGKWTAATLLLCLDTDEAGRGASERLTAGLKRLGIRCADVSGEICGDHKDANEALTANRDIFLMAVLKAERILSQRPDNTQYYIDRLMKHDIANFRDGIKTGFSVFDTESGGGLYSGLYVLAAISRLGKTTLALQLADQLAKNGNDIIFFSLEQSRLELVSKSLARTAAQMAGDFEGKRSPWSMTIRAGKADRSEALSKAVERYEAEISDRMNIVEGNFNCTVSAIEKYVKAYISRTGTKPIVFVDYLQVIQPSPEEKRLGTKEFMDEAVTQIKKITRDLGLTVFLISSVNRANYTTPISFESFKESGIIEYTADVVLGLQLECLDEKVFEYDNSRTAEKRERVNEALDENPRRITFRCLKNRYGGQFDINFRYYPKTDLFIEDGLKKRRSRAKPDEKRL